MNLRERAISMCHDDGAFADEFHKQGKTCRECAAYLGGLLAAVADEREHCLTLIECSIPTLRAMAPTMKDPKVATVHANALEEAGKAVRESGRFRDACELRNSQEGRKA